MSVVDFYQMNRYLKVFGGYSELELLEMYPFEYELYYIMVGSEVKKRKEAIEAQNG